MQQWHRSVATAGRGREAWRSDGSSDSSGARKPPTFLRLEIQGRREW